MLRVSSKLIGEDVNLQTVTSGSEVVSGVPHEAELIRFAEASLGDDDDEIANARRQAREKLGDAGVVDAAGVIANFQRMVRIADGAGIPLDTPMAIASAPMRSKLGIDSYSSSDNTPPLSPVQRLIGRILDPFLPAVFKRMSKRVSGSEG